MFSIFDENVIRITKGNSAAIDITPVNTVTGDPIILSDGEKVLFTIKNKQGATVFQKTLTNGDYDDESDTSLNLRVKPSDTASLPTGEYLYDCLLLIPNDNDIEEAITFISSSIVITKAVGMYSDILGG